jgi:hypothetical protein
MAEDGSGKKTAIIVAVFGLVGTLGAALIANMHKSGESSPGMQQNATGPGAINVGRDATIINNLKSTAQEASEQVRACEQQHGMKLAFEKLQSTEKIGNRDGYDPQDIERIDFRSCTWPKSTHSDEDGYSEIRLRTFKGPGQYEATGATVADRITAPCSQLTVTYGFGSQGAFENEPAFDIHANTIAMSEDHTIWKNDGTLSFYPEAGEFVVLHNSHYGIQSAKCKD